jgi:hypothetical protein
MNTITLIGFLGFIGARATMNTVTFLWLLCLVGTRAAMDSVALLLGWLAIARATMNSITFLGCGGCTDRRKRI